MLQYVQWVLENLFMIRYYLNKAFRICMCNALFVYLIYAGDGGPKIS